MRETPRPSTTTQTHGKADTPADNTLTLSPISELVFLDRYAIKDSSKDLRVGDTVVALVKDDPRFPQREVGIVRAVDGDTISVEVKSSGEIITQERKKIDKPLETHPSQMWDRMAKAIVEVEDEARRAELEQEFRWALENFRFSPGGRINAMLGTGQELTAYNCYVVPMEGNDPSTPRDSRQAIIDTLGNMVEIMSRGGGVGINLSTLRPRLSYVKGVNGRSSGSVSWGGLFSFATGLVEQGGCFDGNQRIATTKGLIPAAELVERIEKGEVFEALTHEGPRLITARFRNGEKPVFRVTTAKGYTVNVTSEHKMGVLRDGQIATVPLCELSVGDETLLLLGTGVESDYVELSTVRYDRSIMSATLNEDVRTPTHLNEDLAYILGYMHGDGYVHIGKKVNWEAPKAIKMATADAYPEIRRTLIRLSKELFNLNAVVETRDIEGCADVALYSSVLIEWLKQNNLLKAKSEDVRVPEAIFRSPSSVMGAFVAGYFDADGSDRTREGGYGFDSVSLEMLRDVQQLLLANGIVSHISTVDRSARGWRTIHRLCVTGAEFKERMSAFIRYAHKDKGVSGHRNHGNNYPRDVWGALNTPGRYYQALWDSTEPRISYRGLDRIREHLVEDGRVALAERIETALNILPDEIVSIEPLGTRDVFDFEVLNVHMLSGNGLYTSNSRRGALMLILNDWHPDILDFIKAKRDMGAITNANISVGVSDDFMKAVEEDKEWQLVFPDTTDPEYDRLWDGNLKRWRDEYKKAVNVFKTVRARDVWNTIIESAWMSAEPGVVFLERMNAYSNAWYFEDLVSTNPCGEQPLPGWGVCNLGHINLSRFANDGEVQWEDLRRAVRLGVRFLDNVIDVTPYFFERNEKVQKDERRVGLGTLGLGEMLIRLGLRYGSDESIAFIDKLYSFIATEAYLSSIEIAKEKGSFPRFDREKFLQSRFIEGMPKEVKDGISKHGIRNVCILTQAPTGSTGTMIGTSTGIEPYYSWTYWRNGRLGMKEVKEAIVEQWFQDHPDVEADIRNLPDYFVTAMDLTPEQHIKVQAAVQRWTDSSISKTANCPHDYTVQQTKELYEYAYKLGCKGVTIYRYGSRDQQVLSVKKDDNEESADKPVSESAPADHGVAVNESASENGATSENRAIGTSAPKSAPAAGTAGHIESRWEHRPQKLTGATYEWPTPLGKAFITVNELEGEPVEVFVNIGKAGSDVAAASEALGRLVTLFLKHAALPDTERKVSLLVDHLANIGGSTSVGFGENRVSSVPDAIAKTLRKHLAENGSGLKVKVKVRGLDLCPTCGVAALAREEGCYVCKSCGYTKC